MFISLSRQFQLTYFVLELISSRVASRFAGRVIERLPADCFARYCEDYGPSITGCFRLFICLKIKSVSLGLVYSWM